VTPASVTRARPIGHGASPASGTCTYNPDGMDPAKKVDPPPAEPTAAPGPFREPGSPTLAGF